MPLVPIALPPGMFRNGTEYGARGRWADGNLVRWHDNALRPIGGWTRRQNAGVDVPSIVANPATETVRDAIAYTTNAGSPEMVFGSNANLYRLSTSNVLSTLDSTGFTPATNEPSELFGYGIGPYGGGLYGTPRDTEASIPIPVVRWNFDMWGENVIAAATGNGPIFEIEPGQEPVALVNAPEDVQDVIVTDQRIVMAIKNDVNDIRQVIWSDRENNNVWTPAVDNYAGDQKLQGTGPLIGLYKVLNQVLVLSATDAFVARFLGAPFVYGFDRVGTNCAPISGKAVAELDRAAIWLGKRNFWIYDGSLRPLDCDVMDFIIETISIANISKIHCQVISEYSEIWWFFQSETGTNVDTYVAYNYREGHWTTGELGRTAGVDAGAYPSPVMVDKDGIIWDHEKVGVLVDGEAFAVSGPIELNNGGKNMAVRYVFPDTEQFGSVELTLYTKQLPTDTLVEHGPYTYENPISTTGVLGREVRMKARGLRPDWEVGTMRFDVQQIGGGFR